MGYVDDIPGFLNQRPEHNLNYRKLENDAKSCLICLSNLEQLRQNRKNLGQKDSAFSVLALVYVDTAATPSSVRFQFES